MAGGLVRPAEEIRAEIARVSGELDQHEHTGELLRKQLAHLMLQARQHPELTIEDARKIPTRQISRQTAYELTKEAEAA